MRPELGTVNDRGVTVADEASTRPLRSDAARNRARVLAAAEEAFAAEGLDVPVDVIAVRAGVGIGTLYRHFPTKEKLFEAILVDRVTAITAEARACLTTEDPATAFFSFLEYLVGQAAQKRDLIVAFASAGVEFDVVAGEAKVALGKAVGELLAAAQDAGTARADVTAPVVLALIGATCSSLDHVPDDVTPAEMLAVVTDGLRPAATRT